VGTLISRTAFQVTDLQRNHREVISEARESGALIRDKDGLMLLLKPAGETQRTEYLVELMADAIRMSKALQRAESDRDPGQYGSFAWASVLPESGQLEFLQELLDQVLVSQNSGSTKDLEDLLGDWQATARTWVDEDLREHLMGDLANPLTDVLL
jgi:hypothetical protein